MSGSTTRTNLECPVCKGRIRDDRLQAEVVRTLERELLHPARLESLERHLQILIRKHLKETLLSRT